MYDIMDLVIYFNRYLKDKKVLIKRVVVDIDGENVYYDLSLFSMALVLLASKVYQRKFKRYLLDSRIIYEGNEKFTMDGYGILEYAFLSEDSAENYISSFDSETRDFLNRFLRSFEKFNLKRDLSGLIETIEFIQNGNELDVSKHIDDFLYSIYK